MNLNLSSLVIPFLYHEFFLQCREKKRNRETERERLTDNKRDEGQIEETDRMINVK